MQELISIKDLVVSYPLETGEIRAVDDVSLVVYKDEILGLIGESGSGKSTLGYAMLNHLPAPGRIVEGYVRLGSTEVTSLSGEALRKFRWKRVSMVFQSAMNALDPVQTVGSQIVETIRQHEHIGKRPAMDRTLELLRLVDIDPSLALAYPHELSGGMRQRVVIALALCLNPEVIIADEPTTGLDVVVQSGVLQTIKSLRDKLGLTVILISHDISIMGAMCDRIAVMYAGKIAEVGNVGDVINRPGHPYTQALLGTLLEIGRSGQASERIPGLPPNMSHPPSGCRFHPRCRLAFERCAQAEPPLFNRHNGAVACWLNEENTQ